MDDHLFPDMKYYGEDGSLYPWRTSYDPGDVAHVARVDSGLRLRLITEPRFTEAVVVMADGTGHPMSLTAAGPETSVWEATIPAVDDTVAHTFALRADTGRAVYRVPQGVAGGVERLDRWMLNPDTVPRVDLPEWARGAFIYQIFPDRFCRSGDIEGPAWGADPDWLLHHGGNLDGITERLGYLTDLGVDLLYLNPIFSSPSTHRYDTTDFYSVDPMLGGDDALRRLVEACHSTGIRVMLDASFNHCHPRWFPFADVVERGPASNYYDWFDIRSHPFEVIVRPDTVRRLRANPERLLRFWDGFEEQSGVPVRVVSGEGPMIESPYDGWFGLPSMPRIDLTNEAAQSYFLDVARYWVREFDIDGWRMDVVRYVDQEFWPKFRAAVKEVKPDAFLLAEVMGDAGPWLQGDQFDSVMNYTFNELMLSFFGEEESDAAEVVEGLVRMYAKYAPEPVGASQLLLSSHDTLRFQLKVGGDADRLRLATIMQFTLPGSPSVHYGDEIAIEPHPTEHSREPFPWNDEASWNEEQRSLIRQLAALRNAHPALRYGPFRPLWWGLSAVAYLREWNGERILVLLDRDHPLGEIRLTVPSADPAVLLGDATVSADANETTVITENQAVVVRL